MGKKRKDTGGETFEILKIVLWPFKILFKAVSITIIYIFNFFEGFLGKNTKDKQNTKPVHEDNSRYEPFKILENISGNFENFEKFIAKNQSTIGIILGARGSGKSAFGLKLLENLHHLSKKNIYAMGFKQENLPDWIKCTDDISQVNVNSFLLIDEGGILFSSRKSFSDANKLLSELLLIARHKDLSVMFISQNSSNLEINAIRQTDYLIMKPSSLLQIDFERKKIKELYEEIEPQYKKYKNTKGATYVYSDKFRGFVINPLPSFWTQDISKSFRNNSSEKKE